MTVKLVCRLLSAEGALLGWCEHHATVRGDGMLRASGPVVIAQDAPGVPVCVSVHWADVNVETRVPCTGAGVIYQYDQPMVVVGKMPGPLPAVTVKSVAIGIPVGHLGAVGHA